MLTRSNTNTSNIKLTLAYDGTGYLGWQKTKMGPSIEESLEKALAKILQRDISLQAASRTDAGVHATGQVVNFFAQRLPSLEKLIYSLNSVLPKEIVVLAAERANDTFHPTLDCADKEYHYHLSYGEAQMPHQRLYAWHYPFPFNADTMRQAIPHLIGKKDFSAFCNVKKNEAYEDTVRDLKSIKIIELPNQCLRFELAGNSFLYKMVRNLVGTLVYVGCGKIGVDQLPAIISSADRTLAGMTAPAHGLFLHKVHYNN